MPKHEPELLHAMAKRRQPTLKRSATMRLTFIDMDTGETKDLGEFDVPEGIEDSLGEPLDIEALVRSQGRL